MCVCACVRACACVQVCVKNKMQMSSQRRFLFDLSARRAAAEFCSVFVPDYCKVSRNKREG